jgi:hypothetical protein
VLLDIRRKRERTRNQWAVLRQVAVLATSVGASMHQWPPAAGAEAAAAAVAEVAVVAAAAGAAVEVVVVASSPVADADIPPMLDINREQAVKIIWRTCMASCWACC